MIPEEWLKYRWYDKERQEWVRNGSAMYYERAMAEYKGRMGMEETIDVECEVVDPKALPQHPQHPQQP